MTAVTGKAVIHVTRAATVLVVHAGAIMGVARDTTKHGIVRGIGVTVIARRPLAGVSPRIDRELVGEHRSGPRGCRVTRLTSSGEPGCHVIGIGHIFEYGCVAGVTGRRSARENASDVTTGALYRDVGASQGEPRKLVVECCTQPARRRVT